MLQIVFDNRKSISDLGDSLLQFFLQKEASTQRKEELKQKQAEFKFDQEQAQAKGQNALQELFGQALAGGLQSPSARNVVNQAGNANIPTSQLQARAPGALAFEEVAQTKGARANARKAALNAAPARSRPLLQAGFDLRDAGLDASVVNTLLDEQVKDLDPTEKERLKAVRDKIDSDSAKLDLQSARQRTSKAAELRIQFPGLANLPDEVVIDVAAEIAKEISVPDEKLSEVALNSFISLMGRRSLNFKGEPVPLFNASEAFDIVETAIRSFRDPEFQISNFTDTQRGTLEIIAGLQPVLNLTRQQLTDDLSIVKNAVTRLMAANIPGLTSAQRVNLFRQQINEQFRSDEVKKDRNKILKAINEAEAAARR